MIGNAVNITRATARTLRVFGDWDGVKAARALATGKGWLNPLEPALFAHRSGTSGQAYLARGWVVRTGPQDVFTRVSLRRDGRASASHPGEYGSAWFWPHDVEAVPPVAVQEPPPPDETDDETDAAPETDAPYGRLTRGYKLPEAAPASTKAESETVCLPSMQLNAVQAGAYRLWRKRTGLDAGAFVHAAVAHLLAMQED